MPTTAPALNTYIQSLPAAVASQQELQVPPVLSKLYSWHQIALSATALDHTTPFGVWASDLYAEQPGPARSSRALAIVHLAMFEAVNAISQKANSYRKIQAEILSAINLKPSDLRPETVSMDMALMQAAHDALRYVYPKKKQIFEAALAQWHVTIADSSAKQLGARVGKEAAAAVIKARTGDMSDHTEPDAPPFDAANPTKWTYDQIAPIGNPPVALGGMWSKVAPFVMTTGDQFRPKFVPPPPGDPRFISAYEEVRTLGGDPDVNSGAPRWKTATSRRGKPTTALDDANETFKAIFWAYDGTPSLCAPPRLYNMIATSVALRELPIKSLDEFARYLAIVNLALADAGISAWDAKYYFNYARPITVIRSIDFNGNAGKGDTHWTPLGAQVTNGDFSARNLTPPFPAYPSGHAVFGAALFQVMRNFFKLSMDGVPFRFVSDEYNGFNRGPGENNPRPRVVKAFPSFTAAEYENAQSRIWMGIHWAWDRDEGIKQGREVGDFVAKNALTLI